MEEFKSISLVSNYFSSKRVLNKKNISQIPNNIKGVYELSSSKIEIYPYLKNRVIYIGSSKNIKKRLQKYTLKDAHSKDIKNFIQNGNELYFRFARNLEYRDFLKRLRINPQFRKS